MAQQGDIRFEWLRALNLLGLPDDCTAQGFFERAAAALGEWAEDRKPSVEWVMRCAETVERPADYLSARFQAEGVADADAFASRWAQLHPYKTALRDLYAVLWSRDRSGQTALKLTHACSAQYVWELLAYGPFDGRVWRWLGEVHLVAREGSMEADAAARVEQEFLRVVALHAAAADKLYRPQLLVLVHLVNYLLPFLRFAPEPVRFPCYAVDLGADAPPQRLLTAGAAVSGPCLDTTVAMHTLQELAGLLQRGMLPPPLLEQGVEQESLVPVVAHLLRHWSDLAPVRKYRHHPVAGRLKAVWGLAAVQALLWGRVRENLLVWEVRNLSKGGLRVAVGPGDTLEVGALVAVRAEDALTWHLGAVRRIERVAGEAVLGVETLSMMPQAVHLQWPGGTCDGIALAAPQARLSLLLPLDLVLPKKELELRVDGAVFRLSDAEAGEQLDDCCLLHFRVSPLSVERAG